MTRLREAAIPAVSRVQIARYACAVDDFNPIHVDEQFAKQAGLPSVIAHGPLTASLVIDELVRQLGVDALGEVDVRLKAPVLPDRPLRLVPTDDGAELRMGEDVAATIVLREAGS
jgi:acyl dehydratase